MTWAASLPWTDKKGRPHVLRSVIFAMLLLPGIVLATRAGVWGLGTRPLKVAIHSTGYWAVWLLLASLLITPAKALTGNPQWPVVRRMVGVAALAYASIHLTLYMADENWRMLHIASEIVSRFYLTLGAVALLGLIVLGATSTDRTMRAMGTPAWKRLHRIVYGIAVLTAVHYTLQSKADVSQALVAAGVFCWLMLWRRLPAGRDRSVGPLLGLAVAAALFTILAEFLWYRFGTQIDAVRAIKLEADIRYGLHPAALVFALGLLVAVVVEVRRLSLTGLGATAWFTVLVYASGAVIADLGAFMFGLLPDDDPGRWPITLAAAGVFAALGVARWWLRSAGQRKLLDALWAACAVFPLLALEVDDRQLLVAAAALVIAGTLIASSRVWVISRMAAVLLLPAGAWIAYAAATVVPA